MKILCNLLRLLYLKHIRLPCILLAYILGSVIDVQDHHISCTHCSCASFSHHTVHHISLPEDSIDASGQLPRCAQSSFKATEHLSIRQISQTISTSTVCFWQKQARVVDNFAQKHMQKRKITFPEQWTANGRCRSWCWDGKLDFTCWVDPCSSGEQFNAFLFLPRSIFQLH